MNNEQQKKTPFLSAIKKYVASDPAPFDVPGHKMGRVGNDLSDYIGIEAFKMDVNAPIGIDNLYKGTGIIKDAEGLLANACNADKALFLVNGTTGGILTMIMGCVDAGKKLILPRNVHKSAINGLIISGAIPVFVEPDYDKELGIANGVSVENYVQAMDENPDAAAVFVINPTYFGVSSDIKTIVKEAHKRNMIVMVDEAHGAHFYFHPDLPTTAMDAGADITSLSFHKTCGSLTQSSCLLIKGNRVDYSRINKINVMFNSTSPSHILIASLDASRKKMALEGKKILTECLNLGEYARKKLNAIPGVTVVDRDYCDNNNSGRFDFDETRLVIRVDGLMKSGFQVYKELKKNYNVQVELAETYLVLAILAIGSTKQDVDRLIEALKDMSHKSYEKGQRHRLPKNLEYDFADIAITPREAFYSDYDVVSIDESEGKISCESVMIYPPGIPILIPGELVTKSIISIYKYYVKSKGTVMSDSDVGFIKVIKQ